MHTYTEEMTITLQNDKGEWHTAANFHAWITSEYRFVDDDGVRREYLITGKNADGDLDEVRVAADDFDAMNWVRNAWGATAIVYPGHAPRLRTAIQIESKPKVTTIYQFSGWTKIDGKPVYLTNGCAIREKGRTDKITVELPADLNRISLPVKPAANALDAIHASLDLRMVCPPDVAWLLLAAAYRAPLGKVDFAVHVTGRTGTYKSELASLIQSHFGCCTARELPAAWSSTANSLEALCHKAKDALVVVDDFIPAGTSYQQRAYQTNADRLIRAAGNQAGRQRLTDTSRHQRTMHPRCLILSTGEDTPEGHSVRGRMMIAELSPGDVNTDQLSLCQNNRELMAESMAGFIQHLAGDIAKHQERATRTAQEVRDKNVGIGHSRTPAMLGSLLAGVYAFLEYATHAGLPVAEANKLYNEASQNLNATAKRQREYLMAADPADQFLQTLRSIFAASAGHAKGNHGGIPYHARLLGWSQVGDDPQGRDFKPHGPRLGWADHKTNTLYLDATVAYDAIRRHSRGSITVTRGTLYKRLREAGHLTEVDNTRQRNTIRKTLENASRSVLALNLKTILEGE